MEKTRVGILGATGIVGQHFVSLLEGHPWFELTWLAASERSFCGAKSSASDWIALKMSRAPRCLTARIMLSSLRGKYGSPFRACSSSPSV